MLLHLTLEVLRGDPPENRDATLGGNLASMLLKVGNVHYMCFAAGTLLWGLGLLNELVFILYCVCPVPCMRMFNHITRADTVI